MRIANILALPAGLAATVYALAASPPLNEYSEHLHLQPLPDGTLYAGFNFTATTHLDAYDNQNFRYFPRSLGQILHFTRTAELHLRFALGRWNEAKWGSRPRDGRREGGTGVELWAWLEADTPLEVEERWSGLVNSLSGLFCASLNFIDQTKTIQPIMSFDPEGTLEQRHSNLKLRHGMLPHEVICTENLTPFLKLLPCKGKAGVSSLLDGHKVFDANWQTMAIDVRPICNQTGHCVLEIQQTVDLVLDIERSMRPKDNPIPHPPPVEEITCDETKPYNVHDDTCYPKKMEGEMGWSLSRIFGNPIRGSCPVDNSETVPAVSLEVSPEREVQVTGSENEKLDKAGPSIRNYYLTENQDMDVVLPHQLVEHQTSQTEPLLHVSRQITGYGQERGGMHTILQNPHPYPQTVVYLESLPWFLRPYMHTLDVNGATVEKMYYTPAVDRQKGTHLELLLHVPAHTTVDLTYDFEKAILRYTEYPPDANRGFDIAPAIIRVMPTPGFANTQGSYLRTTSLLLPLPTPDFSMPYNVIILTSTVIALGFGSIFNLLIRRFVLAHEVPPSPLTERLKQVLQRVKNMIGRGEGGKSDDSGEHANRQNGDTKAHQTSSTATSGQVFSKTKEDGSVNIRRAAKGLNQPNGKVR